MSVVGLRLTHAMFALAVLALPGMRCTEQVDYHSPLQSHLGWSWQSTLHLFMRFGIRAT